MAISNREVFLKYHQKYNNLNDTTIYELLVDVNNFKDFSDLILHFDNEILDYSKFEDYVNKILNGIPLAYVLGYKYFLNLKIKVNQNTLIPREETEELCLNTKTIINKENINHDVIGDICCGSGCIGLYLKSIYKESKIYSIDISKKALDIAKENSKVLGLNLDFKEGNIIDPLIKENIKLDILISNPPYVENKNDIEENVIKYEPLNAIYIEDGTYFYEEIFKKYKNIMNDKFLMCFEINYDQEDKLKKLIEKYFDSNITYFFKKDLYENTRFLFIRGD